MEVLRLKEILQEKKMTGKDLSERVGVSNVAISNIVNGNSFPKPELLLKIAQELDIDVRELFAPTKDVLTEPLFIRRDGEFIQIGEIQKK